MFTLLVIGMLGGLITSVSPCVLPVLPGVLAAGSGDTTTRPAGGPGTVDAPAKRSRRPVAVVLGLVLSFSLSTLLGSVVLSALGLPQDLLRDAGIVVLVIIGLSLLVPFVGDLLERPFARLPRRAAAPSGNGFVLGLGLGLLYVPCAGPVLATIAVVGATHRIGVDAVVLTAAFGVGAGIPLLVLALAGDALTRRVVVLRRRARAVRVAGGVVMIVMAVLIGFNLTDGLQRHVPGYTTALQNHLGGDSPTLRGLTGNGSGGSSRAPSSGDLGGHCTEEGQSLENCGKAPDFSRIAGWLNTPGDAPLTLKSLRGKVVLIDFWTYSCINCQRTLPHVEAWYRNYAKAGLVVVGVHTPEFAFEHVRSNIVSQSRTLGVKYPIAIDNHYGTWNAYGNQYWPAEYLIDPNGNIRHVSFGEGDYTGTELLIRQLLEQAHPGVSLAPPTDVPAADLDDIQTPETYLGYHYAPLHTAPGVTVARKQKVYSFPARLASDTFALSGTWTDRSEYLVAGPDARLELSYLAGKAYLVIGGSGTVTVAIPGRRTRTLTVSDAPKLYALASSTGSARTVMTLGLSPGVQAYDFTFG